MSDVSTGFDLNGLESNGGGFYDLGAAPADPMPIQDAGGVSNQGFLDMVLPPELAVTSPNNIYAPTTLPSQPASDVSVSPDATTLESPVDSWTTNVGPSNGLGQFLGGILNAGAAVGSHALQQAGNQRGVVTVPAQTGLPGQSLPLNFLTDPSKMLGIVLLIGGGLFLIMLARKGKA